MLFAKESLLVFQRARWTIDKGWDAQCQGSEEARDFQMHKILRFLIFIKEKNIIRGQMLTVILEEPTFFITFNAVVMPCEDVQPHSTLGFQQNMNDSNVCIGKAKSVAVDTLNLFLFCQLHNIQEKIGE